MSIAQKLAAIKAAKEARATAAPEPDPAPSEEPETVEALASDPDPSPGTEASPDADSSEAEVARPANFPASDWAALPENIRRLVAMGADGQAAPVNPPEAAQGLAEAVLANRAPELAFEPTPEPTLEPEKKRGRPKRAQAQAPAPSTPSVDPTEIAAIRVAIQAQTEALRQVADLLLALPVEIRKASEASTTASEASADKIVEAVLGAASIFAES